MSLAILRVIGIILFIYLSWRNLKDNYKENSLISYGWIAILSFMLGGRLVYGLEHFGIWNNNWLDWFSFWSKPGLSFLGGYLSMIGASWLVCKKESWKVWPFMEDSSINILILFLFFMMDEFIRSRFSLLAGLYVFVMIVGILLVNYFKQKYRSYAWYRSGKKGFVFFFTNFWVFILLFLISIWLKSGLLFNISFSIISLISIIGLFILGEVFEPLLIQVKRRKNERSKE